MEAVISDPKEASIGRLKLYDERRLEAGGFDLSNRRVQRNREIVGQYYETLPKQELHDLEVKRITLEARLANAGRSITRSGFARSLYLITLGAVASYFSADIQDNLTKVLGYSSLAWGTFDLLDTASKYTHYLNNR